MNPARDLFKYRHLIVHQAWAEFRSESERTYLGMVWWFLDPIINTAVYFVVFGMLIGGRGPDFAEFLVIGIVAWGWFQAGVTGASASIWTKMTIVRQVSFRKMVFPVIQVVVATYRFGFALAVLIAALLLFGVQPHAGWLLAVVPMSVELFLIAGIGSILAAIVPFFPDLQRAVMYSLRFGFFLSCVMYRFEDTPERAQAWLRYNPLVHILNAYRDVFLHDAALDWDALAAIGGLGLAGLACGLGLVYRFDMLYAKRIAQ